jgi:hypothetical protein
MYMYIYYIYHVRYTHKRDKRDVRGGEETREGGGELNTGLLDWIVCYTQ